MNTIDNHNITYSTQALIPTPYPPTHTPTQNLRGGIFFSFNQSKEFPSSWHVLQRVPNSTSLLSHMLCQVLSYVHGPMGEELCTSKKEPSILKSLHSFISLSAWPIKLAHCTKKIKIELGRHLINQGTLSACWAFPLAAWNFKIYLPDKSKYRRGG
jgi:hypothetical protein